MLAKIKSFTLLGIEALPIEIEVDIAQGLPAITLVGMADTCIRESKERIKAALKNSGFTWPATRITVNLSPSDIKKEGNWFDLGIALGILFASGQARSEIIDHCCVLGELSLDGTLKPTPGILAISLAASANNLNNILLPAQNCREAAINSRIMVRPLNSLRQTIEFLNNPQSLPAFQLNLADIFQNNCRYPIDFSEVKGQYFAKRALEIAASGAHNILMIGPAGCGKSMLAKRLATIIPDLSLEEAIEITKIHSISAIVPLNKGIIATRPFRNVHHGISAAALVGGGTTPKPGEISLAHHGVLFLDELPEFRRDCLEALRQPLEDKTIRISRSVKSLSFPADFMLVCAMNPCMCGNLGNPHKICGCSPRKIAEYNAKISGPLLDRIDIHIELPAIKYQELTESKIIESSQEIKARVEKARGLQRQRFKNEGIFYNAQMQPKQIKKYCLLEENAKQLLKMAMTELGLSARAFDKVLKISRTIADLSGAENILAEHISEAIQYRSLDR